MRWDKSKEQENKKKTKDFQAQMAQGYDFKKAYAVRRFDRLLSALPDRTWVE